jgi:hypothetical protein
MAMQVVGLWYLILQEVGLICTSLANFLKANNGGSTKMKMTHNHCALLRISTVVDRLNDWVLVLLDKVDDFLTKMIFRPTNDSVQVIIMRTTILEL